ncbi:MAG: pyridoxal phosphate-dependent aminotransferase [Firmicutes bacterium]|nr:pyridoxal phosphate-dependent aminotransferase [Alicyclobacillaceae bacterium]MCL6496471.1 pyridoxal phosphate-dependent aminotransferase [Bacillota bacterium]
MGLELATRAARLSPSPTMAIDAKAKSLLAEGVDVVNFGAGEPDFDTPAHIAEAGIEAIRQGQTRYTAVAGTAELKAAVIERLRIDVGHRYQPNEVLISVGAKHSLYNAIMAIVDPGDGVLLPVPYWVTYPEQIRLADGEVQLVPIRRADGVLTREDIEAVLTSRSRGLIVNSPSNPSGAVIPPEELRAIAELAVERDLWVISDEIYGRLVYDDAQQVSIAAFPGMRERTIVINGVSKAYAMTGWRIGFAAGPRAIIEAMSGIQSQSTSNPTSIAQAAAVAALTGPQEAVEAMRQEFDRRRRYAVERVNRIRGLKAAVPKGAFYLWVDMSGLIGEVVAGRTIASSDDLALAWLEEAKVAVVPGTGFGAPHYFRLSYATSLERIATGLDRMAALVEGR